MNMIPRIYQGLFQCDMSRITQGVNNVMLTLQSYEFVDTALVNKNVMLGKKHTDDGILSLAVLFIYFSPVGWRRGIVI